MGRRRVLFFSEAVSLAHVSRPTVLADALDPSEFEVHFASSGEYAFCHAGRPWRFHRLGSVSPAVFLQRLSRGWPLYDEAELERYVTEDLQIIESVRPDAIVHDLRLSLAIAARRAGVPLLSLCNAYWSPYARPMRLLAPELPITRWLGHGIANPLINAIWPAISRAHVAGINRLRRRFGMPRYESLRAFYCDGDAVMYADLPQLIPLNRPPDAHLHIGPIVWSPQGLIPAWWDEALGLASRRVYIALGSTGDAALLPSLIAACRDAGLVCLVATAGRRAVATEPGKVYVADFICGSSAAAAADFVVCNGGSGTTYQALAQGRPMLGICSNLDQLLNMQRVAAAGAGVLMHAGLANPARLRASVARLLADPASHSSECEPFQGQAKKLQRRMAELDTSAAFLKALRSHFRE